MIANFTDRNSVGHRPHRSVRIGCKLILKNKSINVSKSIEFFNFKAPLEKRSKIKWRVYNISGIIFVNREKSFLLWLPFSNVSKLLILLYFWQEGQIYRKCFVLFGILPKLIDLFACEEPDFRVRYVTRDWFFASFTATCNLSPKISILSFKRYVSIKISYWSRATTGLSQCFTSSSGKCHNIIFHCPIACFVDFSRSSRKLIKAPTTFISFIIWSSRRVIYNRSYYTRDGSVMRVDDSSFSSVREKSDLHPTKESPIRFHKISITPLLSSALNSTGKRDRKSRFSTHRRNSPLTRFVQFIPIVSTTDANYPPGRKVIYLLFPSFLCIIYTYTCTSYLRR